MRAKQTGPAGTVKALRLLIAAAMALSLLSGCASPWVNSSKTAAEAQADEAACSREAEEDSLARAGKPRADYAPPGGPTAGNLGRSPMEMRDRDAVSRDFNGGVDRCMEAKGYTHGKPGKS
jgi:hypothetical protein